MTAIIIHNVLPFYILFSIIIISCSYCANSKILGFRPSEISTHGSSGHFSHLNNMNSYQIQKFDVKIKENDENSNIFSSLFSSLSKYITNNNNDDENQTTDNQQYIPLEQPFEVQYQCNCDDIYCERIKTSFEKIPNYFTRALDIYTPIKLRLNVFSFSNSEERKNSNALAVTTPPPYLVLRDSEKGWPFSYPLTLIKQLKTDIEIQYDPSEEDYDIDIDINTDQMGDYKYFTGMLAHEILHGMGIYYLIQPLSNMVSNFDLSSQAIVPPLDVIENVEQNVENVELKAFLPPSIYEKNLVDLEKMIQFNGSLSENYYFFDENYYRVIKDVQLGYNIHRPLQDNADRDKLQQFNDTIFNWKGYPTAQDFYRASISSNSIGFLTREGDIIKIQTYDNEYTGDFFHLSTPYNCESKEKCSHEDNTDEKKLEFGPNFVMLSKYYLMDMTVEEKIQHCAPNNTYGLLGDGLVHMLTTMGWTEKNQTPNNKLYYVLMEDDLDDIVLEGPVNPSNEELKITNDHLNVASIVPSSSDSTSFIFHNYIWMLTLIIQFIGFFVFY